MRAHFLPELIVQDSFSLKNDSLHHLVNVIRLKRGEELLLLNGKGLRIVTSVDSISKKELILSYKSHEQVERPYLFDVAIGMPKRDALELCLKQAAELGFRRIYLIRSDYSQMKSPETERLHKVLISAVEQSNSPFIPECLEGSWDELPWNEYSQIFLLDSQRTENKEVRETTKKNFLLIIGPEGGFSDRECNYWSSKENVKVVNLPTPILRTPTALAAGAGMMIERLLK